MFFAANWALHSDEPMNVGTELLLIIEQLTQDEPNQRPTAEEAVQLFTGPKFKVTVDIERVCSC